jgi:hypothetical protein
MKRIVADGKRAVPVLISQIADTRLVTNLVYCYNWGQLEVGELAHFILSDLFVDASSTKSTTPPLFPDKRCAPETPGWQCWAEFKRRHPMKEIQAQWQKFWKLNENRIAWDGRVAA